MGVIRFATWVGRSARGRAGCWPYVCIECNFMRNHRLKCVVKNRNGIYVNVKCLKILNWSFLLLCVFCNNFE